MNRINYRILVLMLATASAVLASCGEDGPAGPGDLIPDGVKAELAKSCGIDVECSAGGIVEGNASISGVASIDAFFQSVLSFQAKAGNVSAGIEAELAAIR